MSNFKRKQKREERKISPTPSASTEPTTVASPTFPKKLQEDTKYLNKPFVQSVDSCPHCGKKIIGVFDHNYTVQTVVRGFFTPEQLNKQTN